MLFTSNATVTGDSLGVITGQQDEDGFAEAVLTTKGQKPTFATLRTDEGLEPADRIVDIIELEYNPETGIALYGGETPERTGLMGVSGLALNAPRVWRSLGRYPAPPIVLESPDANIELVGDGNDAYQSALSTMASDGGSESAD